MDWRQQDSHNRLLCLRRHCSGIAIQQMIVGLVFHNRRLSTVTALKS